MLGSVKYQIEGSKLTIITGLTPVGKITRIPTSDFAFQNQDEKKNLISIEIFGLGKVGRSEKAINFGDWNVPEQATVHFSGSKHQKAAAKVKNSGKK